MLKYLLAMLLPVSLSLSLCLAAFSPALAQSESQPEVESNETTNGYQQDALRFEELVNTVYAYLERLPEGEYRLTDELRKEAEAVTSASGLLRFAEIALLPLADHHAITGSSFSDSYSVVPAYSDMWIERIAGDYVVTSVREFAPAAASGVEVGDRLIQVDGTDIEIGITSFWAQYGIDPTPEQRAFAARVVAAGKRDRERELGFARAGSEDFNLSLPTLYMVERPQALVATWQDGDTLVIRINDALGNNATIAAFDEAMAQVEPGQRIRIDLTNTPSGGNTVIARAILGWFVIETQPYQRHILPREQRQTGIARQWVEEVVQRPGKFHDGQVEVQVGRWTGSMGEGLALGFDTIGACVWGDPMAGLLGAIYDYPLPHSGLVIKLPTERLSHVDGTPREEYTPAASAQECGGISSN